ncbi:hypothetical protein CL618_01360 [archaeon]|nr:hypothetical protein [archaeon]|tara:strand:+ start:282 stop:2078 length:1797 start_codon:yes stop_codon:yes gene_type:complete
MQNPPPPQISEEEQKKLKEKFKKIKTKLDSLTKQLKSKYKDQLIAVSLLPPEQPKPNIPGMPPIPQEKPDPNKINTLVLIDDGEIEEKNKVSFIKKIDAEIKKISSDLDKNIDTKIMALFELRETCYDGKYDIIQMIAMGAPIYDPREMLMALKVSEIHKSMVIKKFEKYVVSYVAAGSLFRGEKANDIDIYIVVDDTDVKRMPRMELKTKLGAIIRSMGVEATMMTGVKKEFHVQVYILTDFWESVKDANPVIFTFLRDGVPLYDRSVFMPWKLLLKMGRIRPSPEAIDLNMELGKKLIDSVNLRLLNAITLDLYYAILNPSQAALMLYGVSPPTPKETIELLNDIFVKKEKILEKEYVDILEKVRTYYKDIEHKKIKTVTGKEIDSLLADCRKYLKRIDQVFTQLQKKKEKEKVKEIYNSTVKITKDFLNISGNDEKLVREFKKAIKTEKLPESTLKSLKAILKIKSKKLSKAEVEKLKKESNILTKLLFDKIQLKRGKELERCKVRFKYGDKYGEALLLDKIVFITSNIDSMEKEISKAKLLPNGGIDKLQKSNLEELESHLTKNKLPKNVFIKEKIFEDLKKLFGKDIEIMVSY